MEHLGGAAFRKANVSGARAGGRCGGGAPHYRCRRRQRWHSLAAEESPRNLAVPPGRGAALAQRPGQGVAPRQGQPVVARVRHGRPSPRRTFSRHARGGLATARRAGASWGGFSGRGGACARARGGHEMAPDAPPAGDLDRRRVSQPAGGAELRGRLLGWTRAVSFRSWLCHDIFVYFRPESAAPPERSRLPSSAAAGQLPPFARPLRL